VIADRSISEADLEAIWGDYLQDIKTYNDDWIDSQFELHDLLTRELWAAVFPANEAG
jgi:hypothetical protein